MSQDKSEVFATGIGCIDGRERRAVDSYMEKNYGVFVDVATKAGMDKHCSVGDSDVWVGVKEDVLVSVQKHNSRIIVVSGHDECAGNPVSREEHFKCIARGIELAKSWDYGIGIEEIEYIGLWVSKVDGVWTASKLTNEALSDHLKAV